jgi:hypothetical protein
MPNGSQIEQLTRTTSGAWAWSGLEGKGGIAHCQQNSVYCILNPAAISSL